MLKVLSLFILLCCSLSFACSPDGYPCALEDEAVPMDNSSRSEVGRFEYDIERGKLRARINTALDAAIRNAAYRLKQKGYKKQATRLLSEWNTRWNGYLVSGARDLGDYKPLSEFLKLKYDEIELLIGIDACKFFRIWDIKVLNFGIPIVIFCESPVDSEEYLKHLAPFLGVVGYWTSYIGCAGATFGIGLLPLICGGVGMLVELGCRDFVAPRVNNFLWRISCQ